ncbi:MAG: hypothetical protein QOI41_7004 [Myxococcales bacterium]|nr:hypothetical protein [Myxococcales bacterium]
MYGTCHALRTRMLALRSLARSSALASLAAACALTASCSSSTSSSPAPAPSAPAAPIWEGAPDQVTVYDGRVASVPIAIRTSDPTTLVVTSTNADPAVVTEIVADATPSTDGLWHGTLVIRPGYALQPSAMPATSVEFTDAAGQHVAKAIALDVHKLGWQKHLSWTAPAGPQTREHGVFLYDADAHAAFLFQGSGYSPQLTPLADGWRLDVASGAWASWTPTGDLPVPGGSRRAAQIPGTKKFYLYGGYIGFNTTAADDGDIYRVDLADTAHTFTRLTSVGAGPARELHTVAYDAKGEQLIVFGGIKTKPSQAALADTWSVKVTGDTATWTALKTSKAPTPRYGSFTAFDEPSRRLVVWSGAQFPVDNTDPVNAAQDAWALDLAATTPTWTKLAPTGDAPKGRRNGCSMPDPAGRRLFIYGGTSDAMTSQPGLYVLDLEPGHEAWTKLDLANAPPLRSSGFGFATPEGEVTCAFGNGDKLYDDVTFLGYSGAPPAPPSP